ncbi:MAG: ANTAR domain-containing protein [Gammaproteobacteria bacterium]
MVSVLLLLERRIDPETPADTIRRAGFDLVGAETLHDGWIHAVTRHDPELLVIRTATPAAKLLGQLRLLQATTLRPVVIFSDDSDTGVIEEAVAAGVGAYVVDSIRADRLKPNVDVARARFRRERQQQRELAKLLRQLDERKRIEKAKGIVMQQKNLSESDAYRLLRMAAMERSRRLVEIADSIIESTELMRTTG